MFKQVMCGLSKWIPDSFRRGLANLPPVRSANHAEGATRSGKIELSHDGGKVCVGGRRGRGKVCDCVLLLPPLLHLLLYPLLSSLPPWPPHSPFSITHSLSPSIIHHSPFFITASLPLLHPSLHHSLPPSPLTPHSPLPPFLPVPPSLSSVTPPPSPSSPLLLLHHPLTALSIFFFFVKVLPYMQRHKNSKN